MNVVNFLLSINQRIIFGIVALGVIIPLLIPMNLPVRVSSEVRSIFLTIEQMAEEVHKGKEQTVLFSFDYDPASKEEINPAAYAILRHCFSRDIKVIVMGHWPNHVGLAEKMLRFVSEEYNKRSGDDYVFLGFQPGWSDLVINMGQDFKRAWPKDVEGRDTNLLTVTRNIHRLNDIDYLIDFAAGSTIDGLWIPFAVQRYDVLMAGVCTAVMGPDLYPFLDSGQINGLISGLAGAAEYEALVMRPNEDTVIHDMYQNRYPFARSALLDSVYASKIVGKEMDEADKINEVIDAMEGRFQAEDDSTDVAKGAVVGGFEGSVKQATIAMNSQNVTHLIIIVFILIGNIAYFITNYHERKVMSGR